jgi:mannose-6-phosphate isomerase-like protein (cupin superfamily)
MDAPRRGRLRSGRTAPEDGEETVALATVGGAVVEQILSGRLDAPVDYLTDVDEWVVVLEGRATLEVAGELFELHAGDWVLLPARTPHRVVDTEPGTNWLTVSGRP